VKIGYLTVSNKVILEDVPVGYLYREESDDANDSGWRVFSGNEREEYVANPENFALYNASTILEFEPALASLLGLKAPIAFARDEMTGEFVQVDD